MLNFEQIKELIELVAQRKLHGLEVERSGFRLKIDGYGPPVQAAAPAAAPSPVGQAGPPAPADLAAAAAPSAASHPPAPAQATPPAHGPAEGEPEGEVPAGAHILTSPIVGTFYRASSPEAEPYANVGDRVKEGQVLCIVEAMKLMNEIEADVDGTVVMVIPENAQPVEFGEPLFAIDVS